MNYRVCIKGFEKYGTYTDVEIKKVLVFLEQKKEFTPLQVSKGCYLGYARAVRIIDVLYELGYTDWPGFTTPSRKTIKLLANRRSKQEIQRHKEEWQ